MQILKLEIENIGPYLGTRSFTLNNRGLVMVMGNNQDELRMDSNGSGKSWLFDCLDWSLFGKVPRGDHVDSVITDKQNFGKVTTTLLSDVGDRITIIRERKLKSKTNLSLFINEVDQTTLDVVATQEKIDIVLGLDRDIFHASVLFSQTDLVHYADSTDKQRIDILTRILNLEEIDQLLENAKKEFKQLNSKQEVVLGQIQVLNTELQSVKTEDYDYNIEVFENRRREDLEVLSSLHSDKTTEKQSIIVNSDPAVIKARIELLSSQMKYRTSDLTGVIDSITNENYELKARKTTLHTTFRSIDKEMIRIDNDLKSAVELICKACNQVVTHDHMKEELDKLNVERVRLQTESASYSTQILANDSKIKELNQDLEKQLNDIDAYNLNIQNQINAEKVNLGAVEKEVQQLQYIDQELARICAGIKTKTDEVNPWIEYKKVNEAKRIDLVGKLDNLNNQSNSISKLKSYYDFWVTAFGHKGLKSYILDSKLSILNEYVNKWIKLLTGGTIWVRFGSTKTTRSKKVVNSPDIKVCRWNPDNTITERNYRSWSGGEKQRISLAIDFGLSALVSTRAKYTYDIVILDEVFKHLDSGGKEAVVEMLKELAIDKSSVFVIDHDNEFQNMFENKIIIRKKDGISHIEEEDSEQQKQKNQGEILQVRTVRKRNPVRQPV